MKIKYQGLRDFALHKRGFKIALIIFTFFIYFICIASGSSVSIIGYEYFSEGDTVTVNVDVDKGILEAIKSIELKPSPEGWPSQTLYSGGQRNWGSSITFISGKGWYSGDKLTYLGEREVKFVIPSNLYLENKTVNLTFEVEYYYAEKI